MIRQAIAKLVQGESLTKDEAKIVMEEIMQGEATPSQIAAFLVALRLKRETSDEISGMAEVMMEKAVSFEWEGKILVDTCGTGGDGIGSFNISTACAFVVAGAGVKVAKHGNRALSSRCGSADVLEEMGIEITIPPPFWKKVLEEVGIAFLYAPFFHQAMKHALPVRKEIGIRTIFNILGPLTNPLRANVRLMGVYDISLSFALAGAMDSVGIKRAFIVKGEDGLDEVSVSARTDVVELREGEVVRYSILPEDFGIKRHSLGEIKGGDRRENARIIFDILRGKEKGAKRDVVLVNSAVCLAGAGLAQNFKEGVEIAADSIDSGKALCKLELLRKFTKSFKNCIN